MEIRAGHSTIEIDKSRGALRRISVGVPPVEFIGTGFALAGLCEIALPLKGYLSHRLRADGSQSVLLSRGSGNSAVIEYDEMRSSEGVFRLKIRSEIKGEEGGLFSLQMKIVNESKSVIPHVLFPNLSGLIPVTGADQTTLMCGRGSFKPYTELTAPDGAVSFVPYGQRYFHYNLPYKEPFCMKWYDLGEDRAGLTLFSKDLTSDIQGLFLEKTDQDRDILRIGWAHYPHIAPGESWESPEFVLYPHRGTWQKGADIYREFTDEHLKPAPTTAYLKDTLGVRSVFMTEYYGARISERKANFRFRDFPMLAEDALKYGVKEIVVWFWKNKFFELPLGILQELGTEEELREAVKKCRMMGVNVVAFVSSRGIKPEFPEDWFEHSREGRKHCESHTHSPDFVPYFNPLYFEFATMAYICPASQGWQKAFRGELQEVNRLGFSSICFDQLISWRLCYNKTHTHRPQETPRYLYQIVKEAVEKGKKIDPEATFSGESFSDISQQFQHYNWDWVSGLQHRPADFAAFRYVFPRFRVAFLVDGSLRWLHEAFVHGLWINFFPRHGAGYIGENKDFSREVQRLAHLKKEFSRFFELGDYLGREVLKGDIEIACAYRYRSELLIIAANSEKEKSTVQIEFPLKEILPSDSVVRVHLLREDSLLDRTYEEKGKSLLLKETLEPNELIVIHIR